MDCLFEFGCWPISHIRCFLKCLHICSLKKTLSKLSEALREFPRIQPFPLQVLQTTILLHWQFFAIIGDNFFVQFPALVQSFNLDIVSWPMPQLINIYQIAHIGVGVIWNRCSPFINFTLNNGRKNSVVCQPIFFYNTVLFHSDFNLQLKLKLHKSNNSQLLYRIIFLSLQQYVTTTSNISLLRVIYH